MLFAYSCNSITTVETRLSKRKRDKIVRIVESHI